MREQAYRPVGMCTASPWEGQRCLTSHASRLIIWFSATEVIVLITLEELQLHRISVSKTYPAGALDYHGAEFRQVGDLKVDAVAELVGVEIRVRGHLGTVLECACDRCLGAVAIPVERDVDLFYRPMKEIARDEEIEIAEDESDVAFYPEEGIELADLVSEQVILSLPMKVVCRPDCRGLCPACGANRNWEPCRCSKQTSETSSGSPFSSLLG